MAHFKNNSKFTSGIGCFLYMCNIVKWHLLITCFKPVEVKENLITLLTWDLTPYGYFPLKYCANFKNTSVENGNYSCLSQ